METDYKLMSTEQLQELLRQDCQAVDGLGLPMDTVLLICNILAERSPKKYTPEALRLRFAECLSIDREEENGTG